MMGSGLSAVSTEVDLLLSERPDAVVFVGQPTVSLRGQVLWADTQKPLAEALVRRSWYPWELEIHDLSSSLERFEAHTDAQGVFDFTNVTPGDYLLRVTYMDSAESAKEQIHKQVRLSVGASSESCYRLYLGKQDGRDFGSAATVAIGER